MNFLPFFYRFHQRFSLWHEKREQSVHKKAWRFFLLHLLVLLFAISRAPKVSRKEEKKKINKKGIMMA